MTSHPQGVKPTSDKPKLLPLTGQNQRQKTGGLRLRLGERQTLLIVGDLIAAGLALVVALYIWASGDQWLEPSFEFLSVRPQPWFFILPVFWIILMVETYDLRRAENFRKMLRGVLTGTVIALVIYSGVYFISQKGSLPRRGVAAFIVTASLLTLFWRLLYIRIFTGLQFVRRSILVGGGETGIALLRVINLLDPSPIHVLGIIDDDPEKIGKVIENYPVVGGCERLIETIALERATELLIAISGEMQSGMLQALLDAQEQGVEITRMPVAYEELLGRVPIHHLEADWIVRSFVDQTRIGGFYDLGKRLVDIVGGSIGVFLLILFFPLIALAIIIDSGRPIFYTQIRSGQGGQPYEIIKFRTMGQDAEPDGEPRWAEENDERATRVGRLLRKTHLDELPQFINVLRGEMSLVGPRAERPELVKLFQQHVPFYRTRLMTKPGITGWAQINFGYAVSVDDTAKKLEFDLYYIKHRSIVLDILIVLRTTGTVLGLRGR